MYVPCMYHVHVPICILEFRWAIVKPLEYFRVYAVFFFLNKIMDHGPLSVLRISTARQKAKLTAP